MDDGSATTFTDFMDFAHVATGLVVLGAQQAQVRRRELQRQLEPHLREAIRRLAAARAGLAEDHRTDR